MGAKQCTISTHNGSAAYRDHNIRNEKVVSKETHINPNGHYEIWKDEPPRQAYHKLFDKAVERYNEKQTREDRKIKNYYSKIEADEKKHPVYEMIIGVYPSKGDAISEEMQKAILKEFVEDWQVRNPNLYMCGAYYHADEEGEPHAHIDYIPVARGYSKGMDTQTGLVKALEQQGFSKEGRETAQIKWERRENEALEKLCKARGLEVVHPIQEGRQHLNTEIFKAQNVLNNALEHTQDMLHIQDDLRSETAKLEAKRDKVESQVQRALERKARAFSRSWKKEKDNSYTYNEKLKDDIVTIVKERKSDVKAISHTNLDITNLYDEIEQNKSEIENLKKQAEDELKKAKELTKNEKLHIDQLAGQYAREIFEKFISEEYGENRPNGRAKRLEKYCSNIKFDDGESVLDKFNATELLQKNAVEYDWSRRQ